MYSIFADGTLIYDDRLNQDDLRVLNPKLTLEDNAAGSFEMSLPPTNVGYGSIARITSIITVKRNGVEIWEGRVLTEDRDFWNNRKLLCEGELAYFNDTVQPPAEYKNKTVKQFLQAIVSNHNSNVAASKRFTVGTVDVTDSANVVYYTNYEKSIDAIGDKLIGVYGGHLRIRKENGTRYLDYLKDYPNTNSQVIRFGENLFDFALNWDMSNFATVLLPLGKRLENSPIENLDAYLTVESVNGGSKYVINQSAVNSYGRIEKIVNWDSVETAAELLAKANEYMADIQYDRLTIELSALDLHYLNVNYEAVKLLDKIRVVSDPHGMDRLFPVTKLEIPLDEPQNTKFRLGDEAVMTLTNLIKNINTDIIYKVETLPKEEVILTKADDRATAIAQDKVDKRTKGYITITQDSNGSDAMYITNQQSISASTKGWKWDLDGLSFATKSAGSETWNTPSVAMNMDGSIVADRITTGTLKSQNNNFSLALNDGTLTMKKGSINIGSNAFKVDTDGSVTITKGTLAIGYNESTREGFLLRSDGTGMLGTFDYDGDNGFIGTPMQIDGIPPYRLAIYKGGFNEESYETWYEQGQEVSGWRTNGASIYVHGGINPPNTYVSSYYNYHGFFIGTKFWIYPEAGGARGAVEHETIDFGCGSIEFMNGFAKAYTDNVQWEFSKDIDGNSHTAYNLLLDPNTSGAVGGPTTTYQFGDMRMTVKNGFITGMSQLDYINHRNGISGRSLGTSVSATQKKNIWNGTFSGIYLGDYWTINGTKYIVVDFDYYYNYSNSALTKHHVVVMPESRMYVKPMNDTADNSAGYANCKMRTTYLNDAKTQINTDFPNLVLSFNEYLSTSINASGQVAAGSWTTCSVEIPNEMMIYGHRFLSTPYASTIGECSFRQLAFFKENPRWTNRQYIWLRDSGGAGRFCAMSSSAIPSVYNANNSNPGVWPYFLIGPSSDPG